MCYIIQFFLIYKGDDKVEESSYSPGQVCSVFVYVFFVCVCTYVRACVWVHVSVMCGYKIFCATDHRRCRDSCAS